MILRVGGFFAFSGTVYIATLTKWLKAQMIADELIRAGTTAQNFYQIKTESLAEAFLAVGDIGLSLIPLIINVEQKIGVTPDYEKNLALVNAMQTDVKNYGERKLSWERTPQSADM